MDYLQQIVVTSPRERIQISIRGAVQGVGFRPHVYRLAVELDLEGWVSNSSAGVEIEAEGPAEQLQAFLLRLAMEAPPHASIQGLEYTVLEPCEFMGFHIRESVDQGIKTAVVLPDIAICADCLAEIRDPANRRYRYPFTNCTHCGPRYSIIRGLPYDRARTTMAGFAMCRDCQAEYADPMDRRFHAQPNACPRCGPQLAWCDPSGRRSAVGDDALRAAVAAIQGGQIVAVKGLGGFHLMVDARQEEAVARLRGRKHREAKPLAVMYPSAEAVVQDCHLCDLELRLLTSPEAPIVLVRKREEISVSASVSPGNPTLGVMVPYTPLHVLLLDALGGPVVATSANLSEEPICIHEQAALERLRGVADAFLMHDRPIARHVDDSVARIVLGREQVLRRARGYAPFPLRMPRPVEGILAVGGHMKNTVAVGVGDRLVVSQHIGDLDTAGSVEVFHRVVGDLTSLYEAVPRRVVCDPHPAYVSTRYAGTTGLPVQAVQHHVAHILGCLVEHQITGPVLGVAWDGTGFGPDGTVWGGEFIEVNAHGASRRVGRLRHFPLPGGDAAVREPRRSAVGVLVELLGEDAFSRTDLAPLQACRPDELRVLRGMCRNRINSPLTSSMGRLFDAVSSLLGLRQINEFEGQAAMELEFAAGSVEGVDPYAVTVKQHRHSGLLEVDWGPLVGAVLEDRQRGVPVEEISTRFHAALVALLVVMAERLDARRVVLTGGCFQNRALLAAAVPALRERGIVVYWPQRIPCNDGGLCVGQAAAASLNPMETD